MKDKKLIVAIVSAVVCIAAIVTLAIVFRDQIADFFEKLKERTAPKPQFTPEECEDFADI